MTIQINYIFLFSNLRKEIQRKVYKNPDHLFIAKTLAAIADLWSTMGDYQKALQQFEKVLGKTQSAGKAYSQKRARIQNEFSDLIIQITYSNSPFF